MWFPGPVEARPVQPRELKERAFLTTAPNAREPRHGMDDQETHKSMRCWALRPQFTGVQSKAKEQTRKDASRASGRTRGKQTAAGGKHKREERHRTHEQKKRLNTSDWRCHRQAPIVTLHVAAQGSLGTASNVSRARHGTGDNCTAGRLGLHRIPRHSKQKLSQLGC